MLAVALDGTTAALALSEMAADTPIRILLGRDDGRSARVLARMLREDGFTMELLLDGAAAVARLSRRQLPHALMTSLHLPSVDGLSVAHYARSRDPTMPVIFITGYPHRLERSTPVLSPAPLVHTKPVNYAVLRNQIADSFEASTRSPEMRPRRSCAPDEHPAPVARANSVDPADDKPSGIVVAK